MNKEELLNVIDCCITNVNNQKLDTALAWIRCTQKNYSPINRLREMGIEEVIVYGITELGELFVQEAAINEYRVLGITDKRVVHGKYYYQSIPVINRDELEQYKDKCIVVTSVTFWDEIKEELDTKGYGHVISLRELMEAGKLSID